MSAGLLRQSQDPADGRGRLLKLSRRGLALYAEFAPVGKEIEESSGRLALSASEWRALHKALGKLSDHARSLADTVDNR